MPRDSARAYFGTDGVRGLANRHPMTPELALALGRAVTYVAGQGKRHAPRILIGKDTRLSGYMLETAIASGVCSMGGRVLLCGPVPTPAVAHLTVSMRADAGIVISASHNPYDDNGIKIFGGDGFKLPDADEARVEALMANPELLGERPTGPGIGRAEKLEDVRGRYIAFAKRTFPSDLTLDGIRVVVDAAHGAAYRVAPLVFTELGASVTAIGVRPNGLNINRDCGALHPDNLRAEVVRRRAHVGVALDGDADRVIVVDEKGQVVDGDAVMALCATRMIRDGELRNGAVVATVMSNLGLERALAAQGTRLVRTAVGDRHVVEAMRKGGYNLGGEQSGHLVFLDHASTGDGIIAGLQVIALMLRSGLPLSELAQKSMERVPQILESLTLPSRRPIDQMPELGRGMASVLKELGDQGRLLVRWSGTEAKLRIMIEGPDEARIRQMAEDLAGAARRDTSPAMQGGAPLTRLGVKIDHVATVRQARRVSEPDPVHAAVLAELGGAAAITVHLRQDRRHIQDRDVEILRQVVKTRLNIETAATQEMVRMTLTIRPDQVTLVPERREEIRTEGGLDVVLNSVQLKPVVKMLMEGGVSVSLFIDPEAEQVKEVHRLQAQAIQINTAAYADARDAATKEAALRKVTDCARLGRKFGMSVHAGHGLTYENVGAVAAIGEIAELDIGHSIVSRAILVGMERAVRDMAEAMRHPR